MRPTIGIGRVRQLDASDKKVNKTALKHVYMGTPMLGSSGVASIRRGHLDVRQLHARQMHAFDNWTRDTWMRAIIVPVTIGRRVERDNWSRSTI